MRMPVRKLQVVDLFCGAGGMSTGLADAAKLMNLDLNLVAINHWPTAIATHSANHPDQRHECVSLAQVDPCALVPGAVEPRRPTVNQWWREKIRQQLQIYGESVAPGIWRKRTICVESMPSSC
jgi:site-specific DNA-cytosine methylase